MTLKRLKELKNNKKGFTLIEIIVVIVILAVLMAVAVPAVLKYVDEADNAKYESTARGAYIAAEAELVKKYTAEGISDDDLNATQSGALKNAVDEVNKGVDNNAANRVSDIDVYKDADGNNAFSNTDNPQEIRSYKITFSNGTTALLVPNGTITITKPQS